MARMSPACVGYTDWTSGVSGLVLKDFGKLACRAAQRRQMLACILHVHARLRRLDGERGEHLSVLPKDGHRGADNAGQELLTVERHLLGADRPQFLLELAFVGERALGEARELDALQEPAPARRRSEREEQL